MRSPCASLNLPKEEVLFQKWIHVSPEDETKGLSVSGKTSGVDERHFGKADVARNDEFLIEGETVCGAKIAET